MLMQNRTFRWGRVGLALASLAVLASCGGHDDGGPVAAVPPPTVAVIPASAAVDVPGFIAFLKTLVVTQQDMAQPLDASAFVAPTSDTTEPDPSI